MIERALADMGFIHVEERQPHADYWLLDACGHGADLLVEEEGEGWRISRSPNEDEPRGEWIEVARELDENGALRHLKEASTS